MPLPKPRSDENKDDFISRCMADETMQEEYPDEAQRTAVCHSQWDKKGANMDKMRVKGLIAKKADGEEVYTAMASNAAIDRDNEIILPTAFKNLAQYLKGNPVVYYDHAWATWDAPREETLPIGKALTGKIDPDNGLSLSWKFTDLEFAQKIKHLVDIGVLNTVSVGFIPQHWDINSDGQRVYDDVELLELSVVGIPSNREAQIERSLTAKGFKPPQIEEAKTLLREINQTNAPADMSEVAQPRGESRLATGTVLSRKFQRGVKHGQAENA